MPKVYSFDVDETLEISNGPIKIESLIELKNQGHIIGICGNIHPFCSKVEKWWEIISFTLIYDGGPWNFPLKEIQLEIFKKLTYKKADEYIMVGNIKNVSGSSDDKNAAEKAKWRFIKESDFAIGMR